MLKWILRVFLFLILLLILAIAAFTIYAQNALKFPALTGSYAVGRVSYALKDESRQEIFTEAPDDIRELMITIHYPATEATGSPAPYVDDYAVDAVSQAIGFPRFLMDWMDSHAYLDATLAPSEMPYPVLVFSPGMGNMPVFYTSIVEDLASHGYIVVSIAHPYSSVMTVFPDGRLMAGNELGQINGADIEAVNTKSDAVLAVWTADMQFVLNYLPELNSTDSLFAGKMALEQVGAFGHSFGGATAAETSLQDERIVAVLNMDGTFYGAAQAQGIQVPLMYMTSELPTWELAEGMNIDRATYDEMIAIVETNRANVLENTPTYQAHLLQSQHNTYTTDFLIVRPVLPFIFNDNLVGKIDSTRALLVINDYVRGFFDEYLRGTESPLLDSSPYPELELQLPAN